MQFAMCLLVEDLQFALATATHALRNEKSEPLCYHNLRAQVLADEVGHTHS